MTMTEIPPETSTRRDPLKARVAVARDLREIEELVLDLHTQALNDPNAHDFPGGTALHMSAPAIALQDWEAQYDLTEAATRWAPDGTDRWLNTHRADSERPLSNWNDPAVYQSEADAADQPLNVLATWARKIRDQRGQPTGLTPTVSREVAYLNSSLDWIFRVDETGTPEWRLCWALADEIHALKTRIENTIRAGSRIDTDASPCFRINAHGERCGGTLARVNLKRKACQHIIGVAEIVDNVSDVPAALSWFLAHFPHLAAEHKNCDQGGRDDLYRCLDCEKIYTEAEYWLAVREHMERDAG